MEIKQEDDKEKLDLFIQVDDNYTITVRFLVIGVLCLS